jgi:hypothetical protein
MELRALFFKLQRHGIAHGIGALLITSAWIAHGITCITSAWNSAWNLRINYIWNAINYIGMESRYGIAHGSTCAINYIGILRALYGMAHIPPRAAKR